MRRVGRSAFSKPLSFDNLDCSLILASAFNRVGCPTEMTTSRAEALQVQRSCVRSLKTFIQSFLHRAWPKTRGPESGSRTALIVIAHAFSNGGCKAFWAKVGTSCIMTEISAAFFALVVPVYFQGRGDDAVPRMTHNLCALRVEYGRCCYCQRPPTSFRRLLVRAMSRNRRAKSSAPFTARPCPMYATIFHATTKSGRTQLKLRCYALLTCLLIETRRFTAAPPKNVLFWTGGVTSLAPHPPS